MPGSKLCPKCQNSNRESANYCRHCGEVLNTTLGAGVVWAYLLSILFFIAAVVVGIVTMAGPRDFDEGPAVILFFADFAFILGAVLALRATQNVRRKARLAGAVCLLICGAAMMFLQVSLIFALLFVI